MLSVENKQLFSIFFYLSLCLSGDWKWNGICMHVKRNIGNVKY